MAEPTHNDAVMTTNLNTLSEKGLKGGHRCEGVYVFMHVWLCVWVLFMWCAVQRAGLGK